MNAKPYRLAAPELTEKDIVGACLGLLQVRGWKIHRMIVGLYWRNRGAVGPLQAEPAGTPDYLCVHPRFPAFYLETKHPRVKKYKAQGGLSPIQQYRIREIEAGRHLKVLVADHPHKLREWLDLHEQVKEVMK